MNFTLLLLIGIPILTAIEKAKKLYADAQSFLERFGVCERPIEE